jgi:hypothetical protein
MKDHIIEKLDSTTELLQYFTGSVTTTQATNKYAATNIGVGLAVGDILYVAGFSNTASNGWKTVTTIAGDNSYIYVSEAIGAGESGVTATFNQEYQGTWQEAEQFSHVCPFIYSSGNAYLYVDQSPNKVNYYTTTRTITAATADLASIETCLPFVRMRVRTNAADQTTMDAQLFGRRIT